MWPCTFPSTSILIFTPQPQSGVIWYERIKARPFSWGYMARPDSLVSYRRYPTRGHPLRVLRRTFLLYFTTVQVHLVLNISVLFWVAVVPRFSHSPNTVYPHKLHMKCGNRIRTVHFFQLETRNTCTRKPINCINGQHLRTGFTKNLGVLIVEYPEAVLDISTLEFPTDCTF